MRPILLRIEGLHSFEEEQTVEFNKLCDMGVFGIFGPTGSGKSTILDAITLALYGKVERAKNGTQGIINQNCSEAYVQFVFQIANKEFIAERTFKRTKDDGVQSVNCRLIEKILGEEKVIAEKKKEMDTKIEEIIGLTGEDFTRAVVLPQGKFAEFLTLQGAERRRMLQRIFALEKYGDKLVKKIRNRYTEVSIRLDQVVLMQNELGNCSKEELKKGKGKLLEQKKKYSGLKKDEELIIREYEKFSQVRKWQEELVDLKAQYRELLSKEKSILYLKEVTELALKAEKLKPFLNTVKEEEKNLQITYQEEQALQEIVKKLEEDFQNITKKYETWEKERQEEVKRIETILIKLEETIKQEDLKDKVEKSLAKLEEDYKNLVNEKNEFTKKMKILEIDKKEKQEKLDYISNKIKNINVSPEMQEDLLVKKEVWQRYEEGAKKYFQQQEEVEKIKREKKLLEDKMIKLAGEVDKRKIFTEEINKKINLLEVPDLTQEEITICFKKLNELQNFITNGQFLSQQQKQIQDQLSIYNQEINKLLTEQIEQKKLLMILEKNKMALQNQLNILREQLKQVERNNLAIILRQELKAGEPCPVCGSYSHKKRELEDKDNINLKELEEKIKQIEEELNKEENKYNDLLQGKLTLAAKLDMLRKSKEELKKEEENFFIKIKKIHGEAKDKWNQFDLENLQNQLIEEEKYLNSSQEKLKNYLKDKDDLEKILAEAMQSYIDSKEKSTIIKTQIASLEENLNQYLQKLQQSQEERDNLKREFEQIAAGLSGKQILHELNIVNNSLKYLEQLRQEEKKINLDYNKIMDDLLLKNRQLQQLQEKTNELIIEGRSFRKQQQELEKQIEEIVGNNSAKKLKSKLEEELTSIKKNTEHFKILLEQKRNELQEKSAEHFSKQNILQGLNIRLKKAQAILEEKLLEYQFVSLNQVEENFKTAEEIKAYQKEIEDYKEKKYILENKMQEFNLKLAGQEITDEIWQKVNYKKENIEKELSIALEQLYRCKNDWELLEKNHTRWMELEKERKILVQGESKLALLEKLFRGNAFVQFIAEEQLMLIAIDASRRLGELTQYRYALELDGDGGFIIRDDANGGLRRPVSTLSGGETFLTSLALALSLSGQIQLRGKYPLEFFFLDEGFGTLDPYLLDIVMDSLEKLQREKMAIGVISHVPELRARLNRKLIVYPAEKGGRGTKLEIELA